MVKYPEAHVALTEIDGNVYSLIGATKKALRGAGAPLEDLNQFVDEATAGDYDNAVQTIMDWVEVS